MKTSMNDNVGDRQRCMNMAAESEFLQCVSAVFNGKEPGTLRDGVTADDVFEIGSRQDMLPVAFCALNSVKPKPESSRWGEHEKRFLDDCMRSEIQMEECRKLIAYLCGNGVKILPLKGCVLKGIYPSPSLRVMSDVDLLYEGVSAKRLVELMEAFGYSTEMLGKGVHDVFYKKPCMNIELHRRLVADNSPYKLILDNAFERAVPDNDTPNLYHMKFEDLYIHVITHAAKHFMVSGLGVRPLGDVYVLNRKYGGSWDRDYIDRQLGAAGLTKFEKKIKDVAYAFFGEETQKASEEDLELFFRGSTYGKYGEAIRWNALAKGKQGYILKKIFPSLSDMKLYFPVLRQHPWAYPFVMVYRWVDCLIHRFGNVKKVFALTRVSEVEENGVKKIMNEYGLGD